MGQSASITQPLLKPYPSSQGQLAEWAQDQYVCTTPQQPASVEIDNVVVTGQEIRAAAASDPYPAWIHGAGLTTPDSSSEGSSGRQQSFTENDLKTPGCVQRLDEIEIRQLLIDHVGHHCRWASWPARTWCIHVVEDCNAYVGTLETFIEERDVIEEVEPYAGRQIDDTDSEPEPGPWLRSEFPLLFVSRKEARVKVPHTEAVEKCSVCIGRGNVACPTCNTSTEPGFYAAEITIECTVCHGRKLIAHADGSDTM